MSKWSFRCRFT